jgi:hypothetical protein
VIPRSLLRTVIRRGDQSWRNIGRVVFCANAFGVGRSLLQIVTCSPCGAGALPKNPGDAYMCVRRNGASEESQKNTNTVPGINSHRILSYQKAQEAECAPIGFLNRGDNFQHSFGLRTLSVITVFCDPKSRRSRAVPGLYLSDKRVSHDLNSNQPNVDTSNRISSGFAPSASSDFRAKDCQP